MAETPVLLAPPDLDWRGDTPVDRETGDIYFSPDDAGGEVSAVFLAGIDAPAVWRGRRRFVIGETGFGTGLNFLMTWDLWRRTAPGDRPHRLHMVSVEGRPLPRPALERALRPFHGLAPLAAQLVHQWPPPEPGFHRRTFEAGQVALTVLFGPVQHMLQQLEARIDAWYLDGFAPAANPAMWQSDVLAEITRLSRPGARLATYTAAGQVRRGLAALGWTPRKQPGFGAKRDRLEARLERAVDPVPTYAGRPWCAPPAAEAGPDPVIVIGHGVAAQSLCESLRAEGAPAVMIGAGDPASAVPAGVIAPRLSLGDDAAARLAARSFLHVTAQAESDGAAGLVSLASAERHDRLVRRYAWGDRHLQPLSADQASDLAGAETPSPGFFLARGGAAGARLARPDRAQQARAIDAVDGGWRVTLDSGEVLDAAVVVLAGGADDYLCPTPLPVRRRAGRIVRLDAPPTLPKRPLSYGGYAIPDTGRLWLGSTFDAEPQNAEATPALLDKLSAAFPDLAAALAGQSAAAQWSGVRVTTPDHLPLCGPLFDPAQVARAYAPLARDATDPDVPPLAPLPGLYILSGLAARGFQVAPLTGDLLAAQITGAPWPLERHMAEAMHPVRFAIKALMRGHNPLDWSS
mgnify:CR=1 FL=1